MIALLVCLIPTTIGGLLSAIGIAGMDRMIQRNVIAMSGRAVEAAGDVDVLLLDKTGTITLGNRQAVEFIPVDGIEPRELAEAAQLASLADETPEGRSIVVLAKEKYGLRGRAMGSSEQAPSRDALHPVHRPNPHERGGFRRRLDPQRCAGYDDGADPGRRAITCPTGLQAAVERIARSGGTPLVVARNGQALGVIHLKDIVKAASKNALPNCARWASRP